MRTPLKAALATALLASCLLAGGATVQPPVYAAAGIVNAASYSPTALAPNTIATIFGTNLSYNTGGVTARDLTSQGLPTTFGGVTVYVGGIAAGLYYVSPGQINFLIPNILLPGTAKISVAREGVAGSPVAVTLNETGPAIFQDAGGNVVATHLDGSAIDAASPAKPNDWVVIYGAGLGRTTPEALTYGLDVGIAVIRDLSSFDVLLNGKPVDRSAIYYAGLAPGFAGLYQIDVLMPNDISANPEVRLSIGSTISVPNTMLPLEP